MCLWFYQMVKNTELKSRSHKRRSDGSYSIAPTMSCFDLFLIKFFPKSSTNVSRNIRYGLIILLWNVLSRKDERAFLYYVSLEYINSFTPGFVTRKRIFTSVDRFSHCNPIFVKYKYWGFLYILILLRVIWFG